MPRADNTPLYIILRLTDDSDAPYAQDLTMRLVDNYIRVDRGYVAYDNGFGNLVCQSPTYLGDGRFEGQIR